MLVKDENIGVKTALGVLLLLYLFCTAYLFVFSGKSEGDLDSANVKLVVAIPSSTATDPYFKEIVDDFEKNNPDISVEILFVSGNFYQKILVMIAGGVCPDLVWMGQGFNEFASRNAFLPIDEFIRNDENIDINDYPKDVLEWYSRNEKLYAIPYGLDFSFLVYNRKLFRENGIPYPSKDWNYEDFLETAKKLTLRDESGKLIRAGFEGDMLLPEAFGARYLTKDSKVECDSPEMIEYFNTKLDLLYNSKVMTSPDESQGEGLDMYSAFVREKVAMRVLYTTKLGIMKDIFANTDWDIAMFPKIKRQAHWASSQAVVITRYTKHPEQAWKLAKQFFSEKFQLSMAFRCLPANRKFARLAADKYEGKPESYALLIDIEKVKAEIPRIPHLQELMSECGKAKARVLNRLETPEEAMKWLQKRLEYKLNKYKRDEK